MFDQIRKTVNRQPATLLQDAVGATALMVMLMVGLHLPGLV